MKTEALNTMLSVCDSGSAGWALRNTAAVARVELETLVDLIRDAIAINNESDPGDYDRIDAWEARAREAL